MSQPDGVAPPTEPAPASASAAPQADLDATPSEIDIDDFGRVDLRVGEVRSAEPVPKADKLLKLSVDLGEAEPRQILAGVAEFYAPDDLVGRKVVVVANLKPRRLRGLESRGMLLAADADGRPVFATLPEGVPNGARLH